MYDISGQVVVTLSQKIRQYCDRSQSQGASNILHHWGVENSLKKLDSSLDQKPRKAYNESCCWQVIAGKESFRNSHFVA